MNTNSNQPRRRPAPQPGRSPSSGPARAPQQHPAGRSALPHPVDTKGTKQRVRQYSNAQKEELERIQKYNPETVKHKHYQSSYAAKRKRKQGFILFFVVFLALALSLLLVFGAAKLVKKLRDSETATEPSVTTGENTPSSADTSEPTSGADSETVTLPETEVASVYAQPTDSTVEMDVEIASTNAILIDLNTHKIIAQKEADERIFPASMTKIMTLLVAVENMISLDDLATVTQATIDYCYLEGASVAGFSAKEVVTVEDLLYGTILPSGADATKTLAECIAGSEENFVKLMNKKAAELGLEGTHFVNSSGLHDPKHYSTVHDIALLLKAALENDTCRKVLCKESYKASTGLNMTSIVHRRTASINSSDYDILGGKTGYTPEAGYCLATYMHTSQNNNEFILVTADGGTENEMIPVNDAKYVYMTYAVQKEESTDIAA